VYQRSLGNSESINLNGNSTAFSAAAFWDNTTPTISDFTVGNNTAVNGVGLEYVAYIFAHDPLGANGDDGLIACGGYTGNGNSNGREIDLGWEPQYVLVKGAGNTSNWSILDTVRGIVTGGTDRPLEAQTSDAENVLDRIDLTATGFKVTTSASDVNFNGGTFIYLAIRAPMMVAPESADEVFNVTSSVVTEPSFVSPFSADLLINKLASSALGTFIQSRPTSGVYSKLNAVSAEVASASRTWDYMNGCLFGQGSNVDHLGYLWKRAKGFFDIVAYTGDASSPRNIKHNLGVAPELIWVKNRESTTGWEVYCIHNTASKRLILNDVSGMLTSSTTWANTEPTEDVFTVGGASTVNQSAKRFVAYLFSTLAGISKVFGYVGNGSTQTIDCGFITGARFVLIKRTDASGDWYLWDTLRGIVAGNDPHISLNSSAIQVTTDDSIDPHSSGFIVNQNAATNVNNSGSNYIGYAIA
jgi:hypothetical protein